MLVYNITLTKKAEKCLDKIPTVSVKPILTAISKLALNPRPRGCKKLKGRDGYRIREGNYRIIYDIFDNELVVDIVEIGHRKDIYK